MARLLIGSLMSALMLLTGCGQVEPGCSPEEDQTFCANAPDAGVLPPKPCGGPPGIASAPNLLENAGFECGTRGWMVYPGGATLSITDMNPHEGSAALQVTVDTAGSMRVLGPEVEVEVGETLCARARYRGTAVNGHLAIYTPESAASVLRTMFSTPLDPDEWAIVPPSKPLDVKVTYAGKASIGFVLQDVRPGDTLVVDDVDFWRSPSGACTELRGVTPHPG